MAALHYQAADSACTLNIMPLDVPCMPDPALGLLITFAIGQISLSLVFVLGRPCQDLLRAASFDGCFITEDAEQQRRKHQSRVEAFSKFLPWWILANDATVFLFIAIDVGTYFDGSQGLGFGPLGSGSFVSFAQMSYGLVVLAFGLVLRFVFTFGTEESTVRDTVLIFVSVTVTMCLAPPYLQPVAMLTRLVLLEIVPEPGWYWRMQVASVPVNVGMSWLKASTNAATIDFMHILVAELVGSLSIVMVHCKNDWAFSKQMLATISAETCAEEANSLSLGVRQLLSVTCDACASLCKDLNVSKPSSSLLGILKVSEDQILNRSFRDFVMADDQEHFQSIVDRSSMTPSSGLVHLVDNEQMKFKAKLFMVQLGSTGHFIGIIKEGHESSDDAGHGGGVPGPGDMHFLLGQPGKFADIEGAISERPDSTCAMSYPLTRHVRDVEELERICLVIDPLSGDLGFTVKSATIEFAELPSGKQQRLANLTEWLDPHWRNEIQNWIEEEVNSSFHGRQKSRQVEGVELLTPGGTMLGDFRMSSPVQNMAQAEVEGDEVWQFEAEIHIQNFKHLLQGTDIPFPRGAS